MQGNEATQASPETITGSLESQEIPYSALPPTFTHPIEYFRLRCLDLANAERGLASKPEDIVKTAKIYADFVLGASGGPTPKTLPYTVGEHGSKLHFSGKPPIFGASSISKAEQRLHTLQKLFDKIEPDPDMCCALEDRYHSFERNIQEARKRLAAADKSLSTLQEEIDNLILDLITHANTDFLLQKRERHSHSSRSKEGFSIAKRDRMWMRQ